jgi:hypothetical protein
MSIVFCTSRNPVIGNLFVAACLCLAASTGSAAAQAYFRGWGPSHQYDNGWNPSVARSSSTVVEVHNGSGTPGTMWWKVGQVQSNISNPTIAWGHSWPYDSGWNPNVALYGTTVVEVHNGSGTAGQMWYKVGQIQSNNTIAWGHSWPYDSGWNPSVALYGTTVVEVHNGSGTAGPMWYKVGQVQSNNTITWGWSYRYDQGWNPSVAVAAVPGFGLTAVEVHNGSGTPGPMWYRVGQVQSNNTITWGWSYRYDQGWNPKVAFGLWNNLLEVHNGGGTAGPMWYHWGWFTSRTTINFQGSVNYDWGYNPSVGSDPNWLAGGYNYPVEVHNGGGSAGPEWYHVGTSGYIQ